MTRKKCSFLFTLFILSTLFVAASLPANVAPSAPSPLGQIHPQRGLAPPGNQTGNGYSMDLTGSVNGWEAFNNLLAKNTFPYGDVSKREASFSNSPPPLAWQQIAVSGITATQDFRPVQGGNDTDYYLKANNQAANWQKIAMRFTVAEKLNLTAVWLFYRLSGLSSVTIPLTVVSTGTTNSSTPALGVVIGSGLIKGTLGMADWNPVPLNAPVSLTKGEFYWIVADASGVIGPLNEFDWYLKYDPNDPTQDGLFAAAYANIAGAWSTEGQVGIQIGGHVFNLLLVLDTLPTTSDWTAPRKYNSPAQVKMYLNATTPIVNNVTGVSNSYRTFVLSTNTSVTFTVNWTARMEVFAAGAVSTTYIARDGFTLWNASFPVTENPPNPYTWYNLTFKVTTIPQFWSQTSPPTNITNTRGYSSTFKYGTGFYLINQTIVGNSWLSNSWLIRTRSSYGISASLPSQVVAGLPLTVSVSTTPYSSSWCNVSFFDQADHIEYTRNATITGGSYQLTLKLNRSDLYTLFLFDRWTGGNEASLNKSLTVTVLKPLSNVTVLGVSQPILGGNASVNFRFFNNTVGAVEPLINPESVKINGTNASFTYSGGVVTVVWNTTTGGWHAGLNPVNVSARSGVFSNSTVTWIDIIQPECVLRLNTSAMQRTWGDGMTVALQCLNTTLGGQRPFPSPPHVKVNGSDALNLVSIGGGNYSFNYATSSLSSAGNYSLVISASYGAFYHNETILNLQLMRLPMALSITMEQTSVYVGSSLSVTATLAYGNGTSAPDGFNLQFEFTVNYKNGSVGVVSKTGAILSGVATSSLSATGDMQSISVRVTYGGDGIRASASDTRTDIPVERPAGLPIMVILGIGGGSGALVVFSVLVLRYRGARKRTEARKVLVLKQSASLAQLIVVHLGSGRCVFSRGLGSEDDVDPNLISGFLSANQAILGEVFKKKGGAGLKFADYGDYKVVSHLGKCIMSTLFCTETAGEELKSVLEKFTEKFEKRYAKVLETWDGDMNAFKDADDIADDVFALPLCAPYTLIEEVIAKERFNGIEKKVLDEARKISAERGIFFMPRIIDFLLTKQGVRRSTILDLINSLTKKGVIKQLNVKEAAELISNGSITVEANR